MDELKPCPLCGSKAKFGANKSCCGKTVRIDCTNPQCGANINAFSSKAEAIKVWNRRAAPENKPVICPLLSDAEVKQPCLEGPCPAILNEPLTVEELRKMEETPVYNVTNTELGNFWALIEKVFTDKVKLVTTDHDHILMLHLDAVKSGSVKLYARKPEGSE